MSSTNPYKYGMSKAELSGKSFEKDGDGKLAVDSIAQMNQDDIDSIDLRIEQEESVNVAHLDADGTVETRISQEESVNVFYLDADGSIETRIGQEESVNVAHLDADGTVETRISQEESVNVFYLDAGGSIETRVSQEESRETALFASLDARLEREEKAVIIRDVPVTGGATHIEVTGSLGDVGSSNGDDIVIHGTLRDKANDNSNPIISVMLSGKNSDNTANFGAGQAGHTAVFKLGQAVPTKADGANGMGGANASDYVCDVTFVKANPDTPSGGTDTKRATDGDNLA